MHFLCGFIGKRRRENIIGPHGAAFDQIRDAMRQHSRFTAAGASENQRRSIVAGNRMALFDIECVQKVIVLFPVQGLFSHLRAKAGRFSIAPVRSENFALLLIIMLIFICHY